MRLALAPLGQWQALGRLRTGVRDTLYNQIFKTLAGAQKRAAFERAHVRDGSRGNVNYRFFVVRCRDGKPDVLPFDSKAKYDYRIEKTLRDYPTDTRTL